jgi:hypothetical protein
MDIATLFAKSTLLYADGMRAPREHDEPGCGAKHQQQAKIGNVLTWKETSRRRTGLPLSSLIECLQTDDELHAGVGKTPVFGNSNTVRAMMRHMTWTSHDRSKQHWAAQVRTSASWPWPPTSRVTRSTGSCAESARPPSAKARRHFRRNAGAHTVNEPTQLQGTHAGRKTQQIRYGSPAAHRPTDLRALVVLEQRVRQVSE